MSNKCAMCGYDPNRATNQEQVAMNHFVNEKDASDRCVINSSKDRITTKDGKVYVREGFKAVQPIAQGTGAIVPVSKTPITNVAPETPTKPVVTGATPTPKA